MKCEYCHRSDAYIYYDVPVLLDDRFCNCGAIACSKCGLERGLICQKHEEAHIAFGHGHACSSCINDTSKALAWMSDGLSRLILENLSADRASELKDWSRINGEALGWNPEYSIVVAVSTAYHVHRAEVDDPPGKDLDHDSIQERLAFVIEALENKFQLAAVEL